MAQVTLLIVNYRTGLLVVDNLVALAKEKFESTHDISVYIVDNNSQDDSCEVIENSIEHHSWGKWVTLVKNPKNAGFAGGNNAAIKKAKSDGVQSDYFYFLNPDAKILPGAIQHLVDFIESNQKIGVAGSRLENEDGSVRQCLFRFPSIMSSILEAAPFDILRRIFVSKLITPPIPTIAEKCDCVSGASFIVRATIVEEVGLMDEKYFLYFEEIDYMKEITRHGWEVWHCPESRVIHLAGQATKIRNGKSEVQDMPGYWYDSWKRYHQKNYGQLYFLTIVLLWVGARSFYNVLKFLFKRPIATGGMTIKGVIKQLGKS